MKVSFWRYICIPHDFGPQNIICAKCKEISNSRKYSYIVQIVKNIVTKICHDPRKLETTVGASVVQIQWLGHVKLFSFRPLNMVECSKDLPNILHVK